MVWEQEHELSKTMTKEEKLEALTQSVIEAVEDIKAQDILVLDVRGQCSFTDRFVVATGRTDRQLKAIAQSVAAAAHQRGLTASIEGLEAMEWLLIDLGDIVVHLFLPDVRKEFQFERLWARPEGEVSEG
jgi:ribosome-associated protein